MISVKKLKKGSIEVKLWNNEKREFFMNSVKVYLFNEFLAIHKNVKYPQMWTTTHIPTGLAFFDRYEKATKAMIACVAIENSGINLNVKSVDEISINDRKTLRELSYGNLSYEQLCEIRANQERSHG